MSMKRILVWTTILGTLAGHSVWAQGIAGDWQGKLGQSRVVLRITSGPGYTLSATLFSIDQSSAAILVEKVTVNASAVTLEVPRVHGSYRGTLSADVTTITGVWTQRNGDQILNFVRATTDTAWALDQSPHTVRFINVDAGVKLEVLDWGGTRTPVVLLAGLGDNAHTFDQFAPKLKAKYHAYAITRRGFGASEAPLPAGENYSANRLGDDVIAVLDTLRLTHPVLVGHSIAGEELSSIGSRYPDRVAGLVYLDAGYQYAIYGGSRPDFWMDQLALLRSLTAVLNVVSPQEDKKLLAEIAALLPTFEGDVKARQKEVAGMQDMTPESIADETKRRQSRDVSSNGDGYALLRSDDFGDQRRRADGRRKCDQLRHGQRHPRHAGRNQSGCRKDRLFHHQRPAGSLSCGRRPGGHIRGQRLIARLFVERGTHRVSGDRRGDPSEVGIAHGAAV
jgi:pimeloyl-ACP methyl ester carboxylesterase